MEGQGSYERPGQEAPLALRGAPFRVIIYDRRYSYLQKMLLLPDSGPFCRALRETPSKEAQITWLTSKSAALAEMQDAPFPNIEKAAAPPYLLLRCPSFIEVYLVTVDYF